MYYGCVSKPKRKFPLKRELPPGNFYGEGCMRTIGLIFAFLFFFLTLSGFSAEGASWTQRAELTASNGGADDQLGESAAISGNTAVLGAPEAPVGSNNQEGAAYVYVKPASGWKNMTQVAELTPSDGGPAVHFGSSVAIDGEVIVVGEPWAKIGSHNSQGALYVYVKPAGGWKDMTETAKLTASDGAVLDLLGVSVTILGDTIVGSAPFATIGSAGSAGAVYVFVKPRSGWKNMTQRAKLTASDPIFAAELGYGVSLSGTTVAAGARNYGTSIPGAAYVFVEPHSGWKNMTQTAKLTASQATNGDQLGLSISINGNVVVAGAPDETVGSNGYQGASYIWVRPASGWKSTSKAARITASDGAAGNYLGCSVSLAGNTLVVGAFGVTVGSNAGQGAVYMYRKPESGWNTTSKFNAKLTASDGTESAWLGNSVRNVSNTVLAGAPGQTIAGNSQQGTAYIFQK